MMNRIIIQFVVHELNLIVYKFCKLQCPIYIELGAWKKVVDLFICHFDKQTNNQDESF